MLGFFFACRRQHVNTNANTTPVVEVVVAAPAPRARKATKRDALKQKAFELAEQGLSVRKIAAEIGVSFMTVQRWFKS